MEVNRRVSTVLGSSTLAITARAKELKAQGHDVVNFAGGEPDFDTPEFIKDAAFKAIKSGFTKYTPSIGTLELREAISNKFKKDNNLEYSPKQIVVSSGAKHSLYNTIQVLVDEGDEVIIPSPFWVSYPEMVKLAGGTTKIITTSPNDNFKLNSKQLSDAVSKKTKLLILNSPSNPTGIVYTKDELKAIADICVKNNIYVISDEIYEKLIYDSDEYVSIASLGKDIYDLTVTVNGVSKAFAMTGWRIGYLGTSQEIAGFIKKIQDHSTSNPSSISQMAALAALQASEETMQAMRDEFKKRRNLIVSLLDAIDEIDYIYPQGAFYIFCNIEKLKIDSVSFAKKFLDDSHVALIPGDGFGASGYVRISFATSVERIEEGIKRLRAWIKNNNKA